MIIRNFRQRDGVQVSALLGQLGYPTKVVVFRKRVRGLKGKADSILVAVDKGKVIGFVSSHLIPLVHENGYLCRVTAFVVDESHRNKGVGNALLRKAELESVKKGAVRAEITSGDHRPKTHRFYQNRGYQEQSKRFIKLF